MRSLDKLLLSGLFCGVLASCSSSSGTAENKLVEASRESDGGVAQLSLECTESRLTYQNFGAPFFLNHCTGCHSSELSEASRRGAPIAINFDNLTSIRAHAGRILARATSETPTMPPEGGPSRDQRKLLAEWLTCGAPGEDFAFAATSSPPRPPPSSTCAKVIDALPAALLPRCSRATFDCVRACADDEACRNQCIAKDATPPYEIGGFSISCNTCIQVQQLSCAGSNGCQSPLDELQCCRDAQCPEGSAADCVPKNCPKELYGYGYCLYYVAPFCAPILEGPAGGCFEPAL